MKGCTKKNNKGKQKNKKCLTKFYPHVLLKNIMDFKRKKLLHPNANYIFRDALDLTHIYERF